MKRVLHVVGGMNIGGTETMLMNLYRKLNHKIQFDFISYYDNEGYYDKEIEALGGNVIKIESPRKIGMIKSILKLKNLIKDKNYDVVHIHTLFNCGIGASAAYLGGCKKIISHSHTTSDIKVSFPRNIYIKLMRVCIKSLSTNLLSCSTGAGEYLFGEKVSKNKKFQVIPNYIDYEKILNFKYKDKLREELNLSKDDILVGNIGRFTESKNHIFLIEVMSRVIKKDSKYKVILVGYGVLEKEIKKKIKELNIEENVYMLGIRNDIDSIVNSLDIFFMPSIYEGLGLVLLEAQAGKLKCLCSSGIQDEADLGLGLMKRINLKGDINLWVEEIIKMSNEKINISDRDILNAFYKKGYSLEDILEKLFEIYER